MKTLVIVSLVIAQVVYTTLDLAPKPPAAPTISPAPLKEAAKWQEQNKVMAEELNSSRACR